MIGTIHAIAKIALDWTLSIPFREFVKVETVEKAKTYRRVSDSDLRQEEAPKRVGRRARRRRGSTYPDKGARGPIRVSQPFLQEALSLLRTRKSQVKVKEMSTQTEEVFLQTDQEMTDNSVQTDQAMNHVATQAEQETTDVSTQAEQETTDNSVQASQEMTDISVQASQETTDNCIQTEQAMNHVATQAEQETTDISTQASQELSDNCVQTEQAMNHVATQAEQETTDVSTQAEQETTDISTQASQEMTDNFVQASQEMTDNCIQTEQATNHVATQAEQEMSDISVQACQDMADISVQASQEMADNFAQASQEMADNCIQTEQAMSHVATQAEQETTDVSTQAEQETTDNSVQASQEMADNCVQVSQEMTDNSAQASQEMADNSAQASQEMADNFAQASQEMVDNSAQASQEMTDNFAQASHEMTNNYVQTDQSMSNEVFWADRDASLAMDDNEPIPEYEPSDSEDDVAYASDTPEDNTNASNARSNASTPVASPWGSLEPDVSYAEPVDKEAVDKEALAVARKDAECQAVIDGVIDGLSFSHNGGDGPNVIGEGNFGKVYSARLNNQKVAVKVVPVAAFRRESEGEITTLVNAHPYTTELHAHYVAGTDFKVEGLVMDYAAANVRNVIETMTKDRNFTSRVCFDSNYGGYVIDCVASAIAYVHNAGIVHLDVNPSNVLLTSKGVPLLADFSSAQCWAPGDEPLSLYPVGTPGFRAPEIIRGQGYNADADWFSFGVFIFYMMQGRMPWACTDESELAVMASRELFFDEFIDQDFIEVILNMVRTDTRSRLSEYTRNAMYSKGLPQAATPPLTATVMYAKSKVFV